MHAKKTTLSLRCVPNVLQRDESGEEVNPDTITIVQIEDSSVDHGASSEERNYVGGLGIYFGSNSVKTCS